MALKSSIRLGGGLTQKTRKSSSPQQKGTERSERFQNATCRRSRVESARTDHDCRELLRTDIELRGIGSRGDWAHPLPLSTQASTQCGKLEETPAPHLHQSRRVSEYITYTLV